MGNEFPSEEILQQTDAEEAEKQAEKNAQLSNMIREIKHDTIELLKKYDKNNLI
jgi:hypothetical protein